MNPHINAEGTVPRNVTDTLPLTESPNNLNSRSINLSNQQSPERIKNDLKVVNKLLDYESLPISVEDKSKSKLKDHVKTSITKKLKDIDNDLNETIDLDKNKDNAYKNKSTNSKQIEKTRPKEIIPKTDPKLNNTRMTTHRPKLEKIEEELNQSGFDNTNENRTCANSLLN